MDKVKISKKTRVAIEKAKQSAPPMYYVADVICTNCLERTILTIPKGVTICDFACTTLCPNCGCTILEDVQDE